MRAETPPTIRLQDYKVVPYKIDGVELDFDMAPNATRVTSRLAMRPNPLSKEKLAPIIFDGEKLKLISVALNGQALSSKDYSVSEAHLTIGKVPQKPFQLVIVTECDHRIIYVQQHVLHAV